MTKQVQKFHSEEFGALDVMMVGGRPYFPAAECAAALGYKNPHDAILKHCIEDGLAKREVIDSLGRKQDVKYISEGNLYRLIIRSRLLAALRFERWVFDKVLPSIRKYGTYITPDALEDLIQSAELTKAVFQNLLDEQEKNTILMGVAAELAPKALYSDRILTGGKSFPVSLIAKDYGFSAVAFNKLLHGLRIQYNIAGTWILYQEYAKKGYTYSMNMHMTLTVTDTGIIKTPTTMMARTASLAASSTAMSSTPGTTQIATARVGGKSFAE